MGRIRIEGRDLYREWVSGYPIGCELCVEGDKTVIFITGVCHDNCFYCPISVGRMGWDSIYVDEERVEDLEDVISYIEIVGGRGASITGGDPLIVIDKTSYIIRRLKESFGERFHIHLYTSGRYADLGSLKILERAGLDEIRFHPVDRRYLERIRTAVRETSMSVGAEIPVIPGDEDRIRDLILYLESIGAEFINLNELEVSERNKEALMFRGFRISSDGISVEGSRETAYKILRWARDQGLRIRVHFCSSKLKDAIQTMRRYRRIAMRVALPHQKIGEDGILSWIEISCGSRSRVVEKILSGYEYYYRDGVYYVHPDINRDRVKELKKICRVKLVERMPLVLGNVSRENLIENVYEL
ncbi:MAG: radical SAM protein [Sulfolobales archaeon]